MSTAVLLFLPVPDHFAPYILDDVEVGGLCRPIDGPHVGVVFQPLLDDVASVDAGVVVDEIERPLGKQHGANCRQEDFLENLGIFKTYEQQ